MSDDVRWFPHVEQFGIDAPDIRPSDWDPSLRRDQLQHHSLIAPHDISGLGLTFVVEGDGETHFITNLKTNHLILVDVDISGKTAFHLITVDKTITTQGSILISFDPTDVSLFATSSTSST